MPDPTYRFRAAEHLQGAAAARSIETKKKAARATRNFRDLLASNERNDGTPLAGLMARMIADGIAGKHEHPEEEQYLDRIERARETARAGNPFHLVALQWPRMVLQDPAEIAIFRAACSRSRYANMPATLRETLLDDTSPPLRLDWWQRLILAAFFDQTIAEIYIKGCTGAGKGGAAALATNLYFDVHHDSRTTITSETYEHAIKMMYGEIRLWRGQMVSPWPSRVLSEGISDHERHYIQVRNPDPSSGEAFSGQHGPNTLYLIDEATATFDVMFENMEKNASKIVALANPRVLSGRFRRAFEPLGRDHVDETAVCFGNIGQRLCITVGGADCLNVAAGRLRKPVAPRGGIVIEGVAYEQGSPIPPDHHRIVQALIPNQIDVSLFRNNCARPEREADVFAHGRFPKEDTERQIILDSWFPRHVAYWESLEGQIPIEAFGLDVARSLEGEGDETMLVSGGRVGIRELLGVFINSAPGVARWMLDTVLERYGINLRARTVPIVIDYSGGYGSSVGDLLKEAGCWVVEFQPGGRSEFPSSYQNGRTDGYAVLGRRLDPRDRFGEQPYAIPPDEKLREELCAPEKRYLGHDALRFGLMSKDDVKAKLGRSPDRGDGVTYCFAGVRLVAGYDELLRRFADRPIVHFPAPTTARERAAVARPPEQETALPDPAAEPDPLAGITLDLTSRAERDEQERQAGGKGQRGRVAPQAAPSAPDRYARLADFYRDQYGAGDSRDP